MFSTVKGEVRVIAPSRGANGPSDRYLDVAVLPDGAANSVRAWAFNDTEGLSAVKVGDLVELDVYTTAKLPKRITEGGDAAKASDAYLSSQVRAVRIQHVAGEKLHKVS